MIPTTAGIMVGETYLTANMTASEISLLLRRQVMSPITAVRNQM